MGWQKKKIHMLRRAVIIGSGPAAHTAAIYLGRALLSPLLFEGFLANGIAAGGQLTTTTEIENFPGHVSIMGPLLTEKLREQSLHNGAEIITETVNSIDLSSRPFKILTDSTGTTHFHVKICKKKFHSKLFHRIIYHKEVLAEAVIIATGAVARRLPVKGAGEDGYWNRGVSACAVCDGAAPIFRNKPVFVIGGGDSALEEAIFLTRYASAVTVVHRREDLRASKVMQGRARANAKITFLMSSEVVECHGDGKRLGSLSVRNALTGEVKTHEAAGMFFAVGHEPATKFLAGQVPLDEDGYIVVNPGTAETGLEGVYAAGDVADKRWRQAITAAGSGCVAALQVEHFLSEQDSKKGAKL